MSRKKTRSILMVRKKSPRYTLPRKGEYRTCDTYTVSGGNDFQRGTDSVPSAAGTQSLLSGQTIPIKLGGGIWQVYYRRVGHSDMGLHPSFILELTRSRGLIERHSFDVHDADDGPSDGR
jgi:hypothetical protein